MCVRRLATAVVLASALPLGAEPVTLREALPTGAAYAVKTQTQLSGRLSLPATKDKPAQSVDMTGTSTIEYDERLLPPLADRAGPRSIRWYRTIEAKRAVGDVAQQSALRPAARRMVVLRYGTREVPFSPDGPLTFGEIDLVRTDVYTPALAGLLPGRAVATGDKWPAAASALEELTDMEKVREGGLECRLDSLGTENGKRVARIHFAGTVGGVNEDGASRQQLDGQITFDLDDQLITGLTLTGVHLLLDADGKPSGRIEGKFTLARHKVEPPAELTDAALKDLTLEPNPDNSLLVYEGSVSGVRLLYPRRWRISAEHGRQITLDEPNGNGILVTAESPEKVPAPAEYMQEAQGVLEKQKGQVKRVDPPRELSTPAGEGFQFALEVELNRQALRMVYFTLRLRDGGATVAARLNSRDAATLQSEVEGIARSIAPLKVAPVVPGVKPVPNK